MGYDLHITRAEDWWDSASKPISRAEWLSYVASDPELRRADGAEATLPDGRKLRANLDADAVWDADGQGEDGPHLWWFEGAIVTKNPDARTIRKMRAIARALGAHVTGDDGERYDEPGTEGPDVQEAAPPAASRGPSSVVPAPDPHGQGWSIGDADDRPWWKRLFG